MFSQPSVRIPGPVLHQMNPDFAPMGEGSDLFLSAQAKEAFPAGDASFLCNWVADDKKPIFHGLC